MGAGPGAAGMSWVLVVVALPSLYQTGGPNVVGQALEWYDPNAHEGRGDAAFTNTPERAKLFRDAGEAMEEWKRTSTVRPVRDDGRPNRPLTAFSVSPMRFDEWQAQLIRDRLR